MRRNLVRPCAQCPFRNDITPYLRVPRIREIERGMIHQQRDFACHKTTKWPEGEDENDAGEMMIDDDTSEACAGGMIMLEKMNCPTQMMRIEERLTNPLTKKSYYNRKKLDMDAPVFDDFDEMAAACEREARRFKRRVVKTKKRKV